MKKNGFTLIELLATIVILTIIVIIALPNVYNVVKNSKKEYVINETKKVYSEAENRFRSGNNTMVVSSKDETKLDGFDSKLQYCVYLSDDGQVVSIKVSDGEYLVSLGDNQTINDLSDKNVEKGNLDNYECKLYNEE